ncbi:PH domain-containing protein [Burkholderia pyrrocinia]|uniref:PH domain-containing protein n=1 Tax=Burkholderia pyrrocinia TaxID=60550 RepID=UPI001BD0B6D5|nr:PH domain-containing protein [Burkholderia pyrrocinia]QVN18987.1 PH domain-containing protein [Burkholderia pyrrocinia]
MIYEGSPSLALVVPGAFGAALVGVVVAATAAIASGLGVEMAWGVAQMIFLLLALSLAVRIVHLLTCRIEIDDARMRVTTGLIVREVCSLELFRIQNVWSVTRWWQGAFGIGELVIETSDARHPVWNLPGLRHPETLRDMLNAIAVELRTSRGIGEVNLGAI